MSDAAPAPVPAVVPSAAPPAGPAAATQAPTTRPRRPLALAVTAVLTAGVFVAVSGSNPVLSSAKTSSSGATEMAYDRDAMADLQRRSGEDRRALMVAWYGALNKHLNEVRRVDQQRASRGEPRQALGAVTAGQYWRPAAGTLTQPYRPGHGGIDIGGPIGVPVLAATDGVVVFAGQQSGYGNHVEIRHADGIVTTYSHLDSIGVAVGEKVETAQQIATLGNTGRSTGPHLHFEVRPSEGATTDPIAWLGAHGGW